MVSAEMISKQSDERKLFTQIIFEISLVLSLLGFIIQDLLLDKVYYWWLGDSLIMDYMLYVRLFVLSVLLNLSMGLVYRHYLYIKTDKKQLVLLDLLVFSVNIFWMVIAAIFKRWELVIVGVFSHSLIIFLTVLFAAIRSEIVKLVILEKYSYLIFLIFIVIFASFVDHLVVSCIAIFCVSSFLVFLLYRSRENLHAFRKS